MAFSSKTTETLERGLYLQTQKGGVSYRAFARYKGREAYHNTETGDRVRAEKIARQWFARFKNSAEGTPVYTMDEAAEIHAEHFPVKKADAKAGFVRRWKTIRSVHGIGRTSVVDVDTAFIRAFVKARGLSETTLKKDIYTIQPILRVAREQGWIDAIPVMPKLSPDRNPHYPFTKDEWKRIQTQMDRDIEDAQTERARAEAQFVYDGAYLIVLGLVRPTEWRKWTVTNLVENNGNVGWRGKRKTGRQFPIIWSRFPRLTDILQRRLNEARAANRARLFPLAGRVFSDNFGALLDRLNLRLPVGGDEERSSWSLRATGVCFEILRQRKAKGTADVYQIATWAGTSVARITNHYAVFLDDVSEVMGERVDYVPFFDDAGNLTDGRSLTMYTREDDF